MRDHNLRDFCVSNGRLNFLSSADAAAVLDLYQRCGDYFLLQDGEPASPADVDELFHDVPPSKRPEDQLVLGYWRDATLLGVVQLLTNYPRYRHWYLGLLLLDPAVRGHGVGRQLYAAVEQWCVGQGAERMLLCVLESNTPAQQFWRSLEFVPVRTVAATRFKQKSHLRYELVRQLPRGMDPQMVTEG